jgi:glycolate oxidase FAD binding subunit
MVRAGSVEEVQAAVRTHARLRAVGGRTKPALSADAHAPAASAAAGGRGAPVLLDVTPLSGVLEYSAAECTFGARAGTTIAEIEQMLARDGLYLPFEPPFGDRGATLGGTVAAGLSGPGRLRYGGVRDFLLGVRFVDGEGRVAHGGGRVVKNAAGFSMQHLLLGSLGRLGVLVELTFKVFPRAPAQRTIAAEFETFDGALDALVRLRRSTFEPDAAELLPAATGAESGAVATRDATTLFVRLAGIEAALDARVSALTMFLGADRVAPLTSVDADAFWRAARELTWCPAAASLVKVPVTPGRLARLEQELRPDVARRYGAGGEVAWIAWPGPLDPLHRLLRDSGLQGLVLTGGADLANPQADPNPLIGAPSDAAFLARVRQALDPRGVFA